MDAISFAVGVQSKDLRGRQLKDLIYRSTSDDGTGGRRPSRQSGEAGRASLRPPPLTPTLSRAPRRLAEERSAS